MKAKILGAAIVGTIVGGIAVSSTGFIKPSMAADREFTFVNHIMAIDSRNTVFFRQEDPEMKTVCYTVFTRSGTPIGASCVKKD